LAGFRNYFLCGVEDGKEFVALIIFGKLPADHAGSDEANDSDADAVDGEDRVGRDVTGVGGCVGLLEIGGEPWEMGFVFRFPH